MKLKFNRISVVGLGYIGLPTAAIIASRGVDVIGIDINPKIIDIISQGEIHIVEPGLNALVRGVVASGKLRATLQPEPADVFLIAVPTPLTSDHKADLSYIKSAAHNIAPVLKRGDLVILESTSPVGTTEQMAQWLAEDRPDLSFPHLVGEKSDIRVAYCPERVLPGNALHELVVNDRAIGGLSKKCTEYGAAFYGFFIEGKCFATNARTAEMVKLAENTFRDINIAFANELSLISERFGIDVWELIKLANHHPRVNILQPGPGVGGHCISVDPWFIVESAPDLARLVHTARLVNDGKPWWVIEKVKEAARGFPSPTVACLGLAFKQDIDDLRESPALEITRHLAEEINGQIIVVEPFVNTLPPTLQKFPNVRLMDAVKAIAEANVIVLLVNHRQFQSIDRMLLEGKIVIDTRGAWR